MRTAPKTARKGREKRFPEHLSTKVSARTRVLFEMLAAERGKTPAELLRDLAEKAVAPYAATPVEEELLRAANVAVIALYNTMVELRGQEAADRTFRGVRSKAADAASDYLASVKAAHATAPEQHKARL